MLLSCSKQGKVLDTPAFFSSLTNTLVYLSPDEDWEVIHEAAAEGSELKQFADSRLL